MDHHHHHRPNPETSLRFRIFVGGRLTLEQWIDAADPASGDLAAATADLHATACTQADAAGQTWQLEVFDPAVPDVLLRIGTDTTGMILPLALESDQ